MEEFHFLSEHNEFDDIFAELEAAIPLAVKLQRERGDTTGALNALRDVVNKAIGTDTPPSSRASFSRARVMELAFDKARLVYQRANRPAQAVASGIVSYFMAAKRMAAGAEFGAALAAEYRSPQYEKTFCHDATDRKEAEESALFEDKLAKDELAKAYAAITDAAILAEATRLLKKMKLDVALANNILAAVSQPPNNPWEMFNAVMSAFGQ